MLCIADPLVIQALLQSVVCARWNDDGSILGVAGVQKEGKFALLFYSPFGEV